MTRDVASSSESVTHEVEDSLQPIPESARTTKLSGQFWIWAGANVAPINWILGALGIHLGLGLADTLTVLIAGNVIGMLGFGFFVILGQRTGATGMLLARGALAAAVPTCRRPSRPSLPSAGRPSIPGSSST